MIAEKANVERPTIVKAAVVLEFAPSSSTKSSNDKRRHMNKGARAMHRRADSGIVKK